MTLEPTMLQCLKPFNCNTMPNIPPLFSYSSSESVLLRCRMSGVQMFGDLADTAHMRSVVTGPRAFPFAQVGQTVSHYTLAQ